MPSLSGLLGCVPRSFSSSCLVSVPAPSRGGRAGGPTATGSDKGSPEVSLPLICIGQGVPGPRLPEQPQDSMGRPRDLWVALARI